MATTTRAQVLAYRVARHGLHRDTTDPTALAVFDLGVQDAGSRSPHVALAARLPTDAPLRGFTTTWAHRGAPHLLRTRDIPDLATALWPRTDADATARLSGCGTALRRAGIPGLDAYTAAAHAMRDTVDTEKPRGQVSTEITARLPAPYAYDCTVCAATHIYGSLFQIIGLFAGISVHADTRPTRLRPLPDRHPVPQRSTGATPVIEAYLRLHGPATTAEVAAFLDTTQTQVKPVWPDDLIDLGDGRWFPETDLDALRTAPDPDVLRLLPPLDPWLQTRDRALIVPDDTHRKRLWRMIGNPGAVLDRGEIVGIWRTKTSGKTLTITVEPFTGTTRDLTAEAERVATARGFRDVRLTTA
ncbi:DNA glycosylase AlkZ-like family protein [Actinokineospora diospyrosa]|uniref:Winged helix DNA-binding domain-containing protein n=1 Tax=Actinokineospora diospyrosa TaxID=103728 RepID=A0ABT1IE58_9PSEU|nr:crosslink repair DNA glycosylase YcaQ family protein [Actinokineospora diospyrosa]MCP2270924.1 Winged helix DNA-binding domain-containing protein [Actinokineospora diospyrosa]